MTDKMHQLLGALIGGKEPDDYVFTRPNGKPVRDFRDRWAKACEAAGVPNLLFHDLRRTAARRLRNSGLSEQMIMRIGGWKTTSVFHRYAIVNRQDMVAAMRQLEHHQAELAKARAENDHTSIILSPSEAEDAPAKKLQ